MMVNYKTRNVYDSRTLYTLEDDEKIVHRMDQILINSKKRKVIYFIKQKICGAVMFGIGIVCPILFDGDATFSLLAVPLGIYLLVTKRQVMSFKM